MQLIKGFNWAIFLNIIRKKNSVYIPRREAGIEKARELPVIVQRKAYDGHRKGHGPESRTIDSSVCINGSVSLAAKQGNCHNAKVYV